MFTLTDLSTKKLAFVLLIGMAAGFLTGCLPGAPDTPDRNGVLEADCFAMGTIISQKVYGANRQAAIREVEAKINELEKLLTFNAAEGDVYKLNENAGTKAVELDAVTIKIIQKAQEISELGNGAFDITIGPLVRSWGIGTEHETIPALETIQQLLPLVNYTDLSVAGNSAGLKKAGQMVDLGGIAKGYAGDMAMDIYTKNGISSALISIGGNIVALGHKPDGTPWKIGIRNPRLAGGGDGQIVGYVKVADKAVVTAGDDQRYFEKDGQRYHHILDPKTGYPAKSDLMSVTLITDTSFDADALDTAVFILGLEKGLDLIKRYGGTEAVLITTDKKVYITEGLQGVFEFADKSNEYTLMNLPT